jgi:hypothetical protein
MKNILITVALVVVFLFLAFVWPTKWKYDHVGKSPIRTNRVTGEVQKMSAGEWR